MNREDVMICAGALDKFGKKHQLIKLVEELSELQKAICKYLEMIEMERDAGGARNQIYEETADVEILIDQLKVMWPHNTIDMYREEKLQRLAQRVNGWRNPEIRDNAEELRVRLRKRAGDIDTAPFEDEAFDALEGNEIREG